jgi:hypothetical protein
MARTVSKHIQIARTEGPEAGLAFYLQTPASARHPQYAQITKRRTDKTRLAAYCSIYADQIGNVENEAQAEGGLSDDDKREIAAMIAASLTGIEVVTETPTVPATVVERGSKKARNGKRMPKAAVNVITRHDAWLIAGADPKFEPKANPDSPANNGQLFRLNMMGKLVLTD